MEEVKKPLKKRNSNSKTKLIRNTQKAKYL